MSWSGYAILTAFSGSAVYAEVEKANRMMRGQASDKKDAARYRGNGSFGGGNRGGGGFHGQGGSGGGFKNKRKRNNQGW